MFQENRIVLHIIISLATLPYLMYSYLLPVLLTSLLISFCIFQQQMPPCPHLWQLTILAFQLRQHTILKAPLLVAALNSRTCLFGSKSSIIVKLLGYHPSGPGEQQVEHEPVMCSCGKDHQWYPGLHQECCEQAEGDVPSLMRCIWSAVFSSRLPSTRETWSYWRGLSKGPQR